MPHSLQIDEVRLLFLFKSSTTCFKMNKRKKRLHHVDKVESSKKNHFLPTVRVP